MIKWINTVFKMLLCKWQISSSDSCELSTIISVHSIPTITILEPGETCLDLTSFIFIQYTIGIVSNIEQSQLWILQTL